MPASRRGVRSAGAAALVVAVAHGVNDAYNAFLHPLLPRIMTKLDLSITLAATLAMTLSLATSVLQPFMGYLADRFGHRTLVVLGPLLSGVFLSLIGVAPGFAALVAFLILGGLGSAAFHPPGAAMAARAADGHSSGLRLSVFSFGGSAGYAVGPVAAVALVAYAGLEGLWLAMIPGILVAVMLLILLPADRPDGPPEPPPTPREMLAYLRGPLGAVFGISTAFAFMQRVFLTMDPIIVASAGGSEATGAFALSIFLAGQALGGLAGGVLTDRTDRRALLAAMAVLAFPANWLALGLPPGTPAAFAAAAGAGFLNMAVLPPIVVMAQEMLPTRAALGSGIVMGLAWAAGSLGVLGTGALGDLLGPRAAALASTPVMLAAALLVLHPGLRAHRRARVSV